MDDKLVGIWDQTRRVELEAALLGTGQRHAPHTWERVEQQLDAYASAWVSARVDACEATHRGEQSGELLDLRMACLDERLTHLRRALAIREQALGPDNPYLAYVLTGLGQALLGLERPAEAILQLERSLVLCGTDALGRGFAVETRFALARALWAAPDGQGRDRARARELVQAARAEAGELSAELRGELESWLAAHGE